jgi:hypothetical protein
MLFIHKKLIFFIQYSFEIKISLLILNHEKSNFKNLSNARSHKAKIFLILFY